MMRWCVKNSVGRRRQTTPGARLHDPRRGRNSDPPHTRSPRTSRSQAIVYGDTLHHRHRGPSRRAVVRIRAPVSDGFWVTPNPGPACLHGNPIGLPTTRSGPTCHQANPSAPAGGAWCAISLRTASRVLDVEGASVGTTTSRGDGAGSVSPSAASSPSWRPTATASRSSIFPGSREARTIGAPAGGSKARSDRTTRDFCRKPEPSPDLISNAGRPATCRTPDHTALAYMDDVNNRPCAAGLQRDLANRWSSPPLRLDLHQVARLSGNPSVLRPRGPGDGDARKRPTTCIIRSLWRRTPQDDATCVDLVFEPRIGEPTLAEAIANSSGRLPPPRASG